MYILEQKNCIYKIKFLLDGQKNIQRAKNIFRYIIKGQKKYSKGKKEKQS